MTHTDFVFATLLLGISEHFVSGQTYHLVSSCLGGIETGGSCTLSCHTDRQTDILWDDGSSHYTQRHGTCYSTHPSLPSGYNSACPNRTIYTISFTNARYDRDSRTWTCGDPFGRSGSNDIKVDIIVSLTNVSLINISTNNQQVGVAESQSLTLTCVTSACYPAASITWYKNFAKVTSEVTNATRVTPGGMVTTSSVTFDTLTRSDLGHRVYCRATNKHSSLHSSTARIDIWYGPEYVDITHPDNTAAIENRDLTLICAVTANPAPSVRWYYSDGTSTGGRTGSVTKSTGSRWSQTLTFRPERKKKTIRCETGNTRTSATSTASETLDVKYPPTRPTLSVPSIVCEGTPVSSLGCSSSDSGNPPASYTWTKNGSSVSPGFSPVKADNGASVWCSASNIFTNRSGHSPLHSDQKDINVHYSPKIAIHSAPTHPLQEGDSLSMTCVSDSNPSTSDSEMKWVFDGKETQGPILQKSDLSRHDHGVYNCTATVNSGICGTLQGNKDVMVKVNYAPDVKLSDVTITEGQTLTVTCQVEGRPATYNFRSFTQYWGDTEIQTRAGQQTSDIYTVRIDTVTYMDSGVYECSVDNGITDRSGFLIQKKNVSVDVRTRPKFTLDSGSIMAAEVGGSAVLYQTFYSKEVSTCNWTFTGEGSGTITTDVLSRAQVTLDVYGRTVYEDGWNVTLTLAGFQERDLGLYIVMVCNTVGCNSSTVNLTAAVTHPSTGLIAGSVAGALAAVTVCLVVLAAILSYRRGYRCTSKNSDNSDRNDRNIGTNGVENRAFSSAGAARGQVQYENVQPQQQPNQDCLALDTYANTGAGKPGAARGQVQYENVQPQQQPNQDCLALDTYANTGAGKPGAARGQVQYENVQPQQQPNQDCLALDTYANTGAGKPGAARGQVQYENVQPQQQPNQDCLALDTYANTGAGKPGAARGQVQYENVQPQQQPNQDCLALDTYANTGAGKPGAGRGQVQYENVQPQQQPNQDCLALDTYANTGAGKPGAGRGQVQYENVQPQQQPNQDCLALDTYANTGAEKPGAGRGQVQYENVQPQQQPNQDCLALDTYANTGAEKPGAGRGQVQYENVQPQQQPNQDCLALDTYANTGAEKPGAARGQVQYENVQPQQQPNQDCLALDTYANTGAGKPDPICVNTSQA